MELMLPNTIAWIDQNGQNNTLHKDIEVHEHTFKISRNLSDSIWVIEQDSVAGFIHTSQGLEFNYDGVIIGPDISLKMVK